MEIIFKVLWLIHSKALYCIQVKLNLCIFSARFLLFRINKTQQPTIHIHVRVYFLYHYLHQLIADNENKIGSD